MEKMINRIDHAVNRLDSFPYRSLSDYGAKVLSFSRPAHEHSYKMGFERSRVNRPDF